ncbi:hypothetical protein AZE42_04464 [Rhizopogon vesiculosus]|uniref:Uncharacterized protein n=1 Tax=Rhizopogon vesiculosus TaxID=180088 RepID=A0A1J8R2I2_9AGAM|nr:hypothetical protein AZE42_04464 [Rhizopogon vesiculosus]
MPFKRSAKTKLLMHALTSSSFGRNLVYNLAVPTCTVDRYSVICAWAGRWRARVHYIVFTALWNATRMSRTSGEAPVHRSLHPSLSTIMLLEELSHHMWLRRGEGELSSVSAGAS